MNINPILMVFAGIFFLLWLISTVFSPAVSESSASAQNTNITIVGEEAAAGLDLSVLPTLVQQSTSAETLEQALNEASGPNNLDLNADGAVDYIHVTEFAETNTDPARYGFSLTTEVTAEETQEIAIIEISEAGDNANVAVSGNKEIYGSGSHYNGSFPLGTMLMMGYLLSPHSFFASPYRYGAYPASYQSPRTVSSQEYVNRSRAYTSSNVTRGGNGATVKSPNAGKSASSIKKGLRNPTSSQRAFQTRSASAAAGSGGFGRGTSNSRSSSAFGSGTGNARSFSSSRRSFGGSFGK